jgi:hypothetical protein
MKRFLRSGASRRYVLVATAAAIVMIAGITVISRQHASRRSVEGQTTAIQSTAKLTRTRTYVTRHVAGQDIQVDTQTGEIKPLTPQEAQQLANGLAPMVDNSTEGLVQVRHADGSVSMDLQGRFQNVAVVKMNTDGTIEQGCVDNPRAAANFFGIDPKLIESAPTARRRNQPLQ